MLVVLLLLVALLAALYLLGRWGQGDNGDVPVRPHVPPARAGPARPRILVARDRPFPETSGRFPELWARMLAFLWKGVLVGLVIAVPAGPVGVLCIRRTIFNGRLAGFVSGLGAATADAIFGIIAGFGLTFVSNLLLDYQQWLRIGGAGFLLFIGMSAFTAEPLAGTRSQRDPETLLADFASTFALTLTNPITILAFLAIFAGIGSASVPTPVPNSCSQTWFSETCR